MGKIIYALSDPRDSRIKYVGFTKDFTRRLHYHYRGLRGGKHNYGQHICVWKWLNELAEEGMLPVGRILQRLTEEDDWESAECYWIAHFRKEGEPLFNSTDGGMGTSDGNWSRVTPERKEQWKENISVGTRRTWHSRSPENRKKALDILAEGRKIRHSELDGPRSPEHKAKISKAAKERWAKWRAERGYTETWDERRKKENGHQGAWKRMTPENKTNALAALEVGRRHGAGNGFIPNDEARKNLSESHKKFWIRFKTPEERKAYWRSIHST